MVIYFEGGFYSLFFYFLRKRSPISFLQPGVVYTRYLHHHVVQMYDFQLPNSN